MRFTPKATQDTQVCFETDGNAHSEMDLEISAPLARHLPTYLDTLWERTRTQAAPDLQPKLPNTADKAFMDEFETVRLQTSIPVQSSALNVDYNPPYRLTRTPNVLLHSSQVIGGDHALLEYGALHHCGIGAPNTDLNTSAGTTDSDPLVSLASSVMPVASGEAVLSVYFRSESLLINSNLCCLVYTSVHRRPRTIPNFLQVWTLSCRSRPSMSTIDLTGTETENLLFWAITQRGKWER
jgi:hypothetical protein